METSNKFKRGQVIADSLDRNHQYKVLDFFNASPVNFAKKMVYALRDMLTGEPVQGLQSIVEQPGRFALA